MLPIPENRILKGLVYMTTIAVVMCYAWLAARLMETSFTPPPKVISGTFYRSEGALLFFNEVTRKLPNESAQILDDTNSLAEKFSWLGHLTKPVRLIVDADHEDRLAVTDERIEVGTKVLMAEGQLKKALLKAWLLQRVSAEIAKSFLRVEVASDVLLAMLEGRLRLQAVDTRELLAFDKVDKAWWSYADSYQGMCKTNWKSLELSSLCGSANVDTDSVSVSALSFRPFLGSRIWKSYLAVPLKGRLAFTKSWVASLSMEDAVVENAKTKQVTGWLGTLLVEMESLLPGEMDPLNSERALWKPTFDAPLIVIDDEGRVAAPGTLRIASRELPIRRAKLAMMTVCQAPTLQDVISISVQSDRVVWRPECAERTKDFVQVRPSSIRLAIKNGLAKPSDKLDAFVAKNAEVASRASEILGLQKAQWDEKAQAYKVSGAIEAVEWYRLGTHLVPFGSEGASTREN